MDDEPPLTFRGPNPADAAAITRLIRNCPPLDVNSHYLSLLLCRDFHKTCVVVERESDLVGFVSAYLRPTQPDTIFVWQVAVDSSARGQGLASRMLDDLLSRDVCAGVRFLEATVTPSNAPSQKLFRRLAQRRGTECVTTDCFTAEMFDEDGHEPEELYRIGPFSTQNTPS